jgi:hypothetical protein
MGDLAHGRNVFPNLPGFMEWTAAGDMDYYNPTPAEIKNGTEKMKHLVENFGLQPAAGANDKKIGFYLVAVFFGTRYVPWSGGRNFTYHFYRRFCDGTWKHKDGMTAVTNLDSSDNIIANPETADKNYLRTEYTHFVGYYFVPNSGLSADTLLEKYPDPKKKADKPFVTWQDVGRYYVDQILLAPWRGELRKEPDGDKKDAEGKQIFKTVFNTGFKDAPENVKLKAEHTERKLIKPGYDCGIRVLYLGTKDKFKKDKFGEIKNTFKQFAAPNLNSFEAINGTDDGFDYPWQDFRDMKKLLNREKMFKRYVKRDFFYPPEMGATTAIKKMSDKPLVNATLKSSETFVLNTEELATIFHFPGTVATTSAIGRIEAQKAEPPANLPI